MQLRRLEVSQDTEVNTPSHTKSTTGVSVTTSGKGHHPAAHPKGLTSHNPGSIEELNGVN